MLNCISKVLYLFNVIYNARRFCLCSLSHSSASLITLSLISTSALGYCGSKTYSRLAIPFADFGVICFWVDMIGRDDSWR